MNRRGFIGALAGMPLAATVQPKAEHTPVLGVEFWMPSTGRIYTLLKKDATGNSQVVTFDPPLEICAGQRLSIRID